MRLMRLIEKWFAGHWKWWGPEPCDVLSNVVTLVRIELQSIQAAPGNLPRQVLPMLLR